MKLKQHKFLGPLKVVYLSLITTISNSMLTETIKNQKTCLYVTLQDLKLITRHPAMRFKVVCRMSI